MVPGLRLSRAEGLCYRRERLTVSSHFPESMTSTGGTFLVVSAFVGCELKLGACLCFSASGC